MNAVQKVSKNVVLQAIPPMATSHSEWREKKWSYGKPLIGQRRRHVEINWDVEIVPGSRLTDNCWAALLESLKVFFHTAVNAPDGHIPLGFGSISKVWAGLQEVVRFIMLEGIESLDDIDSETSWEYLDFVRTEYEQAASKGRPRKLTHASAVKLTCGLVHLWDQRKEMAKFGVSVLPEAPFDGQSSFKVVTGELALKRKGGLKPIPDEIAFPILNRATEFIQGPAQDIIELHSQVLELLGYSDVAPGEKVISTQQQYAAARMHIEAFMFSTADDTQVPWRAPIMPSTRQMLDGRDVDLSLVQSVRRLVLHAVGAACTVIQGLSGVRAHELCGIGQDYECDTVQSISVETDKRGLLECFYLHGMTAKGTTRKVKWLIGSRPAGSSYVPPTVTAFSVIHNLLSPYRRLGKLNELLVSFKNGRGLPKSSDSIGNFGSCFLTQLQREFVDEYVCFPNISSDVMSRYVRKTLRGHQWRTTFAVNIYSISSTLLPAIRDHLKHMKVAYTESGYIGSDPALIDACDSARTLETARYMLALSTGSIPLAGSMAKLVERHKDELLKNIKRQKGKTDEDKAVAFVEVNDIALFQTDYARCFMTIMPNKSECHNRQGTPTMLRERPAAEVRSPEVCTACSACAIDRSHLPFWKDRLEQSNEILRKARMKGEKRYNELRVEQERNKLASRIVKAISKKATAA